MELLKPLSCQRDAPRRGSRARRAGRRCWRPARRRGGPASGPGSPRRRPPRGPAAADARRRGRAGRQLDDRPGEEEGVRVEPVHLRHRGRRRRPPGLRGPTACRRRGRCSRPSPPGRRPRRSGAAAACGAAGLRPRRDADGRADDELVVGREAVVGGQRAGPAGRSRSRSTRSTRRGSRRARPRRRRRRGGPARRRRRRVRSGAVGTARVHCARSRPGSPPAARTYVPLHISLRALPPRRGTR